MTLNIEGQSYSNSRLYVVMTKEKKPTKIDIENLIIMLLL